MPPTATLAVLVAVTLDRLVAEPPRPVHPVAWFGRLVAPLDREWARPRLVGLLALALPVAAALVVASVVLVATRRHPVAGWVVAGLVLFSATSLRMLLDEARAVVEASETDPETARARLPALVGRDPSALAPGEMRSAAVESAAENLSDGLVAPLLAFGLGALVSLPVAAGAATFVKTVNTCDSMLGYRSKPVGWAAARLDDLVMFVPARASAGLLAAVALAPGAIRRATAWARAPTSPNSGWPMATLATAIGVRLSKPGAYDLDPAGQLPDRDAATRALRLVGRAGTASFLLAGVIAWF